MEYIERNIFVLSDINAVQPPIEYVQGTNALPIVFHFCDWDIPSNAAARVYIKKPSGKAEYDSIASVSGNDITIDVKDTMFSETGRSFVQILINNAEKTLVTFEYPVDVKRNNVAGEIPESENNSNFLDEYLAQIDGKMNEAEKIAGQALTAADTATNAALEANRSASDALESAEVAENFVKEAESFAHGGTGTRQNEDVDNAKYYYQQTRQISSGLSGALAPMGTVAFADLNNQTKQAGYMYNISDAFTTDDTFKEGAGFKYPEGTNVYYTADGYWDCLAGTITPEGIGALAVDGDSAENIVSFTSADALDNEDEPLAWTDVDMLKSGEKHKSIFNKISTMFKNIRYLYKMVTGINTDLQQNTSGQFVLPNGLKMCWGTRLQGESLLDIQFPFVFSSEPTVFVSSRWLTDDVNNLCFARVIEVHVHKFNAVEHYSDTAGSTWYGRYDMTNGINWFAIGY